MGHSNKGWGKSKFLNLNRKHKFRTVEWSALTLSVINWQYSDLPTSRSPSPRICHSSGVLSRRIVQRRCIVIPHGTGWNCRECEYRLFAQSTRCIRSRSLLCIRLGQGFVWQRRQISSDFEASGTANRATWTMRPEITGDSLGQTLHLAPKFHLCR